jgi:hydroxymethylglutaryl-CoA reductase (NADPH)
MTNQLYQTIIPTKSVGPIAINFSQKKESFLVPLATYEKPLFYTVSRGAKVTRQIGGINATIIKSCMTRSVILEAQNAKDAYELSRYLEEKSTVEYFQEFVTKTSAYAKLLSITTKIIAKIIYIRFTFDTKEASGHNMATKAADYIIDHILKDNTDFSYISISGNICCDKKNSSINSILGRGHSVIIEGEISSEICRDTLRTTPEKIVELNNKKNLIGSIIAGGVQTANAHFANMMAAFYLATGQDVANIVEGSQGITYAEVTKNQNLYFSVSCPNIIIGTIGNGKDLSHVLQNLKNIECYNIDNPDGSNAKKLAQICASAIWCGELSLLAAITNKGELVASHIKIER